MVGLIAVSVALLSPPGAQGEKPESLRRAEEARSATRLMTAQLELVEIVKSPDGTTSDVRAYSFQVAGPDYSVAWRGNADGIVIAPAGGAPASQPYHFRPMRALFKDGEVWSHQDGELKADTFGANRRRFYDLHDPRRLGLDPVAPGHVLDEVHAQQNMPPIRYAESRDGDLFLVTGESGPGKVQWWIDPNKDWSVVRTAVWLGDRQLGEVRYTVESQDGGWFPTRIERHRLAAGDTEPSAVTLIARAEFNRPEHAAVLTPGDIGVEPGMEVHRHNHQPPVAGMWDGQEVVHPDQFETRLAAGEIALGPTVARQRALFVAEAQARKRGAAGGGAGSTASRPVAGGNDVFKAFETEWEARTRRFIARYHLDKDQAEKAWAICRDCQERGREYASRRAAQFEALAQRSAEAREGPPEQRVGREDGLAREREELLAPVRQIFEQQLVPRLEAIPTRAQREAVDRTR